MGNLLNSIFFSSLVLFFTQNFNSNFSNVRNLQPARAEVVKIVGKGIFQATKIKTKEVRVENSRRGLYVKLIGGLNFLNGGDFGDMIQIREKHMERMDEFYKGLNLENPFSIEKSPFFWGFGAEIGYHHDKFAVGFEVGPVSRTFTEKTVFYCTERYCRGEWNMTFSALPILLNLQMEILHFSFLKVNFAGGGGLYLGKYKGEQVCSDDSSICLLDKSKQKSYGFHIGVPIELRIFRKLSFHIEPRYRFVIFNRLKGTSTEFLGMTNESRHEGDLYYYKYEDDESAGFNIGPVAQSRVSQRRADLNLDGFALNLGIKLIF